MDRKNVEQQVIDLEQFQQVEIRIGTVLDACLNEKARKPAFVLQLDFGEPIGIKLSSAQLTENYTAQQLIGKQLCAVINFPARRIAGIKSEVLVLAGVCEARGTVLLLPSQSVENGTRVA